MRGFYTILIATSSLLVGPMITSTDAVPWFNIKNWFSRPPLNYEFTVDELAKINADESLTIKECLGPKTYHTAPWVMETTTKKPMWIIAPSVQSSPEWSRLSFRPAAASYQIIPPANGPTYIICAKDKKLVTTTRLRLMRLRKGAWFVGPALPKQISRGYSATKEFHGNNNIITRSLGFFRLSNGLYCLHTEYLNGEGEKQLSELNKGQHMKTE